MINNNNRNGRKENEIGTALALAPAQVPGIHCRDSVVVNLFSVFLLGHRKNLEWGRIKDNKKLNKNK